MKVYMDNAATTPVRKEVIKAMLPYFNKKFGNASSLHLYGREARDAIENARKTIARIINAEPEEIIFTSGGTESDNMAIKEIAFASKTKHKNEIITSKIEHDAVLESCKMLEKIGFKVHYVNVNKEGIVDIDEIKRMITDKTILVSIMHANNEIGTIQPIEEIGRICKRYNVYFHTDAVQTFCKLPIDVKKMNIDLLSASSHKIYGPKGVGFLYIRKGIIIEPLIHGGGHEFGFRSGTENVPGIVGFAKAAELANKERERERRRLKKMRDRIIRELKKIEGCEINGSLKNRLENNINVSFRAIEGESILLKLDKKGIAVSTGSACSSKSLEPSHVLLALGLPHIAAHGSIRISLGRFNTEKEVDYLLKVFPKVIEELRKISPFK
ncbi:MAG: cysteine desulfurase NifS [Candidatus Pacearchaeota archaeon]